MKDPKKKVYAQQGDPKRGDEILRTMLKTKPKTHEEMVKESKGTKRGKQR